MDPTDDLSLALGKRLRQRRNHLGLTARDVGMGIGLKKEAAAQHIYRYEHGVHAPHARHLLALARVLDTTVGELLGEHPPKAWLLSQIATRLEPATAAEVARQLGLPPPPFP